MPVRGPRSDRLRICVLLLYKHRPWLRFGSVDHRREYPREQPRVFCPAGLRMYLRLVDRLSRFSSSATYGPASGRSGHIPKQQCGLYRMMNDDEGSQDVPNESTSLSSSGYWPRICPTISIRCTVCPGLTSHTHRGSADACGKTSFSDHASRPG